jgi:site-specific recombinase XerC
VIREYGKFLVDEGILVSSPAANIAMPKKERKSRVFLRVDEYMKLLNAATGHSRDYAILQLSLQRGIRVAELAGLTLSDIDLDAQTMLINGKGNKQRTVYLVKKAIQALKAYLADRPKSLD